LLFKKKNNQDYLSLTYVAKFKNSKQSDDVIKKWLRNRFTIELLGFWEKIYNPSFNSVEFDGFRNEAGINSYVLTPNSWIEKNECNWNYFNGWG